MARPTQLRVAGERMPEAVEPGSPLADVLAAQALNGGSPLPSLATSPSPDEGARIIAALRAQLAETDRERQTAQAQAQLAERTMVEAKTEIESAYTRATQAVQTANAKVVQAETQAKQNAGILVTLGLGLFRQGAEHLMRLFVFLMNRLPSLAALAGGYLLWDSHLTSANVLTLIGLGLYGALIVLPTIWLAVKSGDPTGG